MDRLQQRRDRFKGLNSVKELLSSHERDLEQLYENLALIAATTAPVLAPAPALPPPPVIAAAPVTIAVDDAFIPTPLDDDSGIDVEMTDLPPALIDAPMEYDSDALSDVDISHPYNTFVAEPAPLVNNTMSMSRLRLLKPGRDGTRTSHLLSTDDLSAARRAALELAFETWRTFDDDKKLKQRRNVQGTWEAAGNKHCFGSLLVRRRPAIWDQAPEAEDTCACQSCAGATVPRPCIVSKRIDGQLYAVVLPRIPLNGSTADRAAFLYWHV